LFISKKKRIFVVEIMATKTIDRTTSNKISFVAFIIPAFAEAYKMSVASAYQYLKKYGGLEFLYKHWWALHTDNDIWAIHNIYKVCLKNGGMR
jgi:hypothetical protein